MRKTVYIIDENKGDREIIRQTIAGLDRHAMCLGFSDSITALRRLNALIQKPSLIVIDLKMPLISGKDWIDFFHNEPAFRDIPVTGFAGNSPGWEDTKTSWHMPMKFFPNHFQLTTLNKR